MHQLLQNVSTGEITVEQMPAPSQGPGAVLVATRCSVISAGTERAATEIGRASLVGKARARPDLVKKVVQTARAEGVGTTYKKVRGRLGEPNALGYSLSGVVLEGCEGSGVVRGDRVACAGAGYASHAEVVAVPRNLVVRVPEAVSFEDAAYGTIATIALHGVRLAEVGLGSVVAVVGLGLVGQLTIELLLASGAVVVGVDPDPTRAALARNIGCAAVSDADEFEGEVMRLSDGRGADGVLICAASRSASPLTTATAVARERAVVCVVGDVLLESPRAPLFSKELRLVVSRSYGPGRYDPSYEELGIDYPAGYVRWTEGRNLEEVVRLMATGVLRPSRLTTHRFPIADGDQAYGTLGGPEPSLGILLDYPPRDNAGPRSVAVPTRSRSLDTLRRSRLRVGVVGPGAFARGVLMPAIARHADITAVASATGVSARATATRFNAAVATTQASNVLQGDDCDAVIIATRHDTHAAYTIEALNAGKHVFVEKPLALNQGELDGVLEAAAEAEGILMVGFNRRFAPGAIALREIFGGHGPLLMSYRVNAGRLPASHWTHDATIGGGRIVGEGCHFLDLMHFLASDAPITGVSAAAVSGGSEPPEDNVSATLQFADGSVGQLTYAAYGDGSLPKERIEVLGEVGAAVLDDFRDVTLYRAGSMQRITGHRDKGHEAEVELFARCCKENHQPWPLGSMTAVTQASFAIRDIVAPALIDL